MIFFQRGSSRGLRPMPRAAVSLAVLAAVTVVPSVARSAPMASESHPTKSGAEVFEKKVRPILVRHCYECHSGDPKKAKSRLVLDTREGLRKGGESGPVIVPGHPDESPLIEAVRYEGLEMPPKEQLPDELIDILVEWVQMGAPDPRSGKGAKPGKIDLAEARKFWAFQKPKAVPPPRVDDQIGRAHV